MEEKRYMTIRFNGHIEVEAKNEVEAIEKFNELNNIELGEKIRFDKVEVE